MAKLKPYIKPNITLEEFIAGEELTYAGADFRPTQLTYRVGVGAYVERDGKDLGLVTTVQTDAAATRVFHNITRRRSTDAQMTKE